MPVLIGLEESPATILVMDKPHPGFRRATAVSWTLAGVGAAGVVGASLLAWADTLEKQADAAMPALLIVLCGLVPVLLLDRLLDRPAR